MQSQQHFAPYRASSNVHQYRNEFFYSLYISKKMTWKYTYIKTHLDTKLRCRVAIVERRRAEVSLTVYTVLRQGRSTVLGLERAAKLSATFISLSNGRSRLEHYVSGANIDVDASQLSRPRRRGPRSLRRRRTRATYEGGDCPDCVPPGDIALYGHQE